MLSPQAVQFIDEGPSHFGVLSWSQNLEHMSSLNTHASPSLKKLVSQSHARLELDMYEFSLQTVQCFGSGPIHLLHVLSHSP